MDKFQTHCSDLKTKIGTFRACADTVSVSCAYVLLVLLGGTVTSPAFGQVCNPATFGVTPGNVDSTAFNTLLSSCHGKTIQFPAGVYVFTPTGTNVGFYIPGGTSASPTSLIGNGASGSNSTIFQIANTGTYQALLWARNVSNVAIQKIHFIGSSYSSGCPGLDYGHAIYVLSDAGMYSSVENVTIANNVFTGFNGQYWVEIRAADQGAGVGLQTEIAIAGNTFDASAPFPGGCASTGGINYPVFMVDIEGSSSSSQGLVENVSISSNIFYANYVKGAVSVWGGASHITIQYNNPISDAGSALTPAPGGTELGRYAIQVYDSTHGARGAVPPNSIAIVANTITNPTSCGVYVAAGWNVQISHNAISGQHDTYDGTLPKGAIALNHAINTSTYNDDLANNFAGFEIAGGSVTTNVESITVPLGSYGMKIFMDNTSNLLVQNTTVTTTVSDGTPSSVIGYGYSSACTPSCAQSAIKNLSQIGWPASSGPPPSLRWYSTDGTTRYHFYSDVKNIAFTGITRQANAGSQPLAQPVLWPYLN